MNKIEVICNSELPLIGLTPRQTQVLALLLDDVSVEDMAITLKVSQSVIKTHMSAIFKSFAVDHRYQLIARCLNYCIQWLESQHKQESEDTRHGHAKRNGNPGENPEREGATAS